MYKKTKFKRIIISLFVVMLFLINGCSSCDPFYERIESISYIRTTVENNKQTSIEFVFNPEGSITYSTWEIDEESTMVTKNGYITDIEWQWKQLIMQLKRNDFLSFPKQFDDIVGEETSSSISVFSGGKNHTSSETGTEDNRYLNIVIAIDKLINSVDWEEE